jgi:hypothetical protein
MKSLFILGLVLLAALPRVEAVLGVDVSQLFPTSTYQCMKSNGYTFAIIRGYCSYGGPDHNAVQNLNNARAAGLITDIYMFPCRGKIAQAQVDEMFSAIKIQDSGEWFGLMLKPTQALDVHGADMMLPATVNS